MRFRRKLLAEILLAPLLEKSISGVPIARLARDHNLDISNPHLVKLINWYEISSHNIKSTDSIITKSLFPPWLLDIEEVQEQPYNYDYKGVFPFGNWELNNK